MDNFGIFLIIMTVCQRNTITVEMFAMKRKVRGEKHILSFIDNKGAFFFAILMSKNMCLGV